MLQYQNSNLFKNSGRALMLMGPSIVKRNSKNMQSTTIITQKHTENTLSQVFADLSYSFQVPCKHSYLKICLVHTAVRRACSPASFLTLRVQPTEYILKFCSLLIEKHKNQRTKNIRKRTESFHPGLLSCLQP